MAFSKGIAFSYNDSVTGLSSTQERYNTALFNLIEALKANPPTGWVFHSELNPATISTSTYQGRWVKFTVDGNYVAHIRTYSLTDTASLFVRHMYLHILQLDGSTYILGNNSTGNTSSTYYFQAFNIGTVVDVSLQINYYLGTNYSFYTFTGSNHSEPPRSFGRVSIKEPDVTNLQEVYYSRTFNITLFSDYFTSNYTTNGLSSDRFKDGSLVHTEIFVSFGFDYRGILQDVVGINSSEPEEEGKRFALGNKFYNRFCYNRFYFEEI